MNMVRRSSDGVDLESLRLCDFLAVRPEFWLENGNDVLSPLVGAEDEVDEVAGVRVGHNSPK
jgi:hypothetical protein